MDNSLSLAEAGEDKDMTVMSTISWNDNVTSPVVTLIKSSVDPRMPMIRFIAR